MKTIKDKGKVYQVGALYEFSDDGKHWYVDVLEDVRALGDLFTYKARLNSYDLIRVCEVKAGTIEEAPIKLKHGECYRYTDHAGNEKKGYFVAEHSILYCAGSWSDRSRCTNIKLLTVGETK